MVFSSDPQPPPKAELINYLSNKLGLTHSAIELGIRQSKLEQAPLPIILWSFGLISLKQYQDLLDWEDAQL